MTYTETNVNTYSLFDMGFEPVGEESSFTWEYTEYCEDRANAYAEMIAEARWSGGVEHWSDYYDGTGR